MEAKKKKKRTCKLIRKSIPSNLHRNWDCIYMECRKGRMDDSNVQGSKGDENMKSIALDTVGVEKRVEMI